MQLSLNVKHDNAIPSHYTSDFNIAACTRSCSSAVFSDGVQAATSSVDQLVTPHRVIQRADIRQEESIRRSCF